MKIQIIISAALCLTLPGTSGDSQNKYMEHEIEDSVKKDSFIVLERNQTVEFYQKKIDSLDKVIPVLKTKINEAIEMKKKVIKAKNQMSIERKWLFFRVKPEIEKIKMPAHAIIDSVFVPPMPQPLKRESFFKRIFHHKTKN